MLTHKPYLRRHSSYCTRKLHRTPSLLAMDPKHVVVVDLAPWFRIFKSGRVESLVGTDFVPGSVDPASGVASQDVKIDPTTGVSARLYLPTTPSPSSKLPILIYFHGGGFVAFSAFSAFYHNYITSLSSKAAVLVVSVEYRLAPEHPLPAAHEDSLAAFKWVVSHSTGGGEDWLSKHGDFSRLFIAGDSAGGNIAHHVAVHAGGDVKIEGMALVHPFFWGTDAVRGETTDPSIRELVERLWRMACPSTEGMDDPLINPLAAEAPPLKGLAGRRVVVFVAGKDFLKARGHAYYEALVSCGWEGEAELVEDEDMDHIFHLSDPEGVKAVAKMERMAAFLLGK